MLTMTLDTGAVDQWSEAAQDMITNPEPLLLIALQQGQTSVQRNFEVFGRPSWSPRSPVTEKILASKRGSSIGVLMRITGRLANATGVGGQVGAGGELKISGNEGSLINRIEYGYKLQYGDPGGEPYIETVASHQRTSSTGKTYTVKAHERNVVTRPIPPRPFMMWQQEDADDIQAYCQDYIDKKFRGEA